MNVSYIYVNIAAFVCFVLMFVAFCAAERSREMRAWLLLLGDMVLWTGGSLFMRLNVYPSYRFWYYVSLLALFSIAFLVYNYVCRFAKERKRGEWAAWLVGTVIVLVISATGYFLAPPELTHNAAGKTVFKYSMDWRIGVPTVFFMFIVASIIKLFLRILRTRGRSAPGVAEMIIGCFLLAAGNIIQILPGNIFPWDTLSGCAFAIMLILSLYKRRMFDTRPVISLSILVLVSGIVCVGASALFFNDFVDFMRSVGGHLGSPEAEAFVLFAVILFAAISAFRKMLSAIFSIENRQGARIKQYSDSVSKTLDIDSILRKPLRWYATSCA